MTAKPNLAFSLARIILVIPILLVILFTTSVRGQSIPYRDISSGDMYKTPPQDALDLRDGSGKSVGKVWFEQWREQIVVFGTVNHDPFQWARIPLEFGSRAHVNLWLSASRDVPMPEIAWGSQFGYTNCKQYESAPLSSKSLSARPGDCAAWSASQARYRDQLRRLFVRDWEVAPFVSAEVFATDAFRQVLAFARNNERTSFTKLEPKGEELLYFDSYGSADVARFQIRVPLTSLPPSPTLELSSLFAVIEVAEGERLVASTAPSQIAGDPSSLTRLTLARPIVSKITECANPLTGSSPIEGDMPAWYFPNSNGRPADTFILANDASGYRYEPEGLSPRPFWKHHFEKDLGGGIVCGPALRFVAGNKTWNFNAMLDEGQLKSFQLANGSWLLSSGPTRGIKNPLGSGVCGACYNALFSVYHLDAVNGVARAFSDEIVIDERVVDGDFQISPDWKTIFVYRGVEQSDRTVSWSSDRFCLSEYHYTPCGAGPASPPPEPRQVSFAKRIGEI